MVSKIKHSDEDQKNILWKHSMRGFTHQILSSTSIDQQTNSEIVNLVSEIKQLRTYFIENHPDMFGIVDFQDQMLQNKDLYINKIQLQTKKLDQLNSQLSDKLNKLEIIRLHYMHTNPEFFNILTYLQELQVAKHQISISSELTQIEFDNLQKITTILNNKVTSEFTDYSQYLKDHQYITTVISLFETEPISKNEQIDNQLQQLKTSQVKFENNLTKLKADILSILNSEINLTITSIQNETKYSEFRSILAQSKVLKLEIISESQILNTLKSEFQSLLMQLSTTEYYINRISYSDLELAQNKIQKIQQLQLMIPTNFDDQNLHDSEAKSALKSLFELNLQNQSVYDEEYQKANLFKLKLEELINHEEQLDFILGTLFAQLQNSQKGIIYWIYISICMYKCVNIRY